MINKRFPVIIWLFTGCFLIAFMVVVGGITRLTGSGLSIVEWNLIMGTLPPLNMEDWQELFEKYKTSPQFQKVNYDYSLQEFKSIFWWEYIHRLIGRIIGLVFFIPFIYFLFKGYLNARLIKKLSVIFALGALQGFLGWYMVQSGLVDNPHVSHYRLAIHLITAFITYGLTLWVALELLYSEKKIEAEAQPSRFLKLFSKVILLLIIVQVIYGAFVAGLKAGRIYNTFPKMGSEWIPEHAFSIKSFWLDIVENIVSIQFIHRTIAWVLVFLVGLFIFIAKKEKLDTLQRNAIKSLVGLLFLQFILGVLTLLYAVPLTLGVLHQLGAFALFTSAIILEFQLQRKS